MNISMLVLNNFVNDARVHKEAMTLALAGHKVTVIALWNAGLLEIEQISSYRVLRLRLHTWYWQNRFLAPLVKYCEFAWTVWRLVKHEPAEIYHANDANTLPIAWLAAQRNHALIVYDAHELEIGRNFSGSSIPSVYSAIWALPERLFIKKATHVITVSPLIARELSNHYHIPLPTVILNCPERTSPIISDRLRQELGIPTEHKILLYQGKVAPGRGIDAFILAVQSVENVYAVILGEGPAVETFRQQSQLNGWQRVFFPGHVPLSSLPEYTASADVGISLIQDTCLSYRLSLPNKLFEYLHAGLPVLCSDLPEMARVVREHQVGELANPEDPESIVKGLQTILCDPASYGQMKANALKAAERFNWQIEGGKLAEIYWNLSSK